MSKRNVMPEVATGEAKLASMASDEACFINEKTLLQRLPISRRTAANHRENGTLPFVRLGGRNLYHWPSVEAALLRQQRGGGQFNLPA
jgi:hypothetical protein